MHALALCAVHARSRSGSPLDVYICLVLCFPDNIANSFLLLKALLRFLSVAGSYLALESRLKKMKRYYHHFFLLFYCFCALFADNYEYEVQERPITIISRLKSQVLVAGEYLILHCNASLSSKSTVLLEWRHNGQCIGRDKNENKYNVSVFIHGNYISSELSVNNVSFIDAGDYECLALDGVRRDGSAVFIATSNNASVKVLDKVLFTGVVTVTKNIGQHVVLPCNISYIENVTWQKNNLQLPPDLKSLVLRKNGDLLLLNSTKEDEGIYQCSTPAENGPIYVLSLTTTEFLGIQPRILLDPTESTVKLGGRSSVSCCVLGIGYADLDYQLMWFQRDSSGNQMEVFQLHSNDFCNELLIPSSTVGRGRYEYECKISVHNITLNSSIVLNIEDFPSIPDRLRVRNKFISYYQIIESIQCPLSNGSNIRYKWYKNGIDITSSSNSTGYLRYWTPNNEVNVGIFQCFAENSVGSDHAIVRVLHRGFSNPPANFTCRARDQSLDVNSPPVALIEWAPPNLNTSAIRTYIVEYNGEEYSTNNTFFEINLKWDQLSVRFNVYVKNSISSLLKNGTRSSCEIQSTLERRTSPENARRATFICPSDFSGNVSWDNPSIHNRINFITLLLSKVCIRCICLHLNHIKECGGHEEFATFIDTPTIFFPVESQPMGSMCVAGGNYSFRTQPLTPLTISPEICRIGDKTSTNNSSSLPLTISCRKSATTIILNEPLTKDSYLKVEGHCILFDVDTVLTINDTLTFNNSEVFETSAYSEILTCSILAYFINSTTKSALSEEIQCVADEYVFFRLLKASQTEVTGTNELYTSDGSTTPENVYISVGSQQTLQHTLVQASVVIALVILSSILITLLLCLQLKRNTQVRNKMWQEAEEAVKSTSKINVDINKESNEYEDCYFPTNYDTDSVVTMFEQLDHQIYCHSAHLVAQHKSVATRPIALEGLPMWQLLRNMNGSSSSGYGTESESREYFIARDSELSEEAT